MAIFLRGNVWWMEYRTRKVRKVVSTGFRKEDKVKAQAAFDAFRLGMGAKPKRSAMEGILDAIYSTGPKQSSGIALSSMWAVYADWCAGKGKVVAQLTEVNRRNLMARFCEWASGRGILEADGVTVSVARDYVASLRTAGKANKTLRTYCQYLGGIWKAVGQMVGGRWDNPWSAACPDLDGSSDRREAFSVDEEARVLSAAREVGHDWWLASMVSRWTGLRYGDVARLDWASVDLANRVIELSPSKTRKHGVSVMIPIASPLCAALSSIPEKNRTGFVLPLQGACYPNRFDPPFSEVLRRAGLDGGSYTFHSWRHTFRTRLADAGVSDEVARRLGGWTNISMAAHYDHARHLNETREAIARMEGEGASSV